MRARYFILQRDHGGVNYESYPKALEEAFRASKRDERDYVVCEEVTDVVLTPVAIEA